MKITKNVLCVVVLLALIFNLAIPVYAYDDYFASAYKVANSGMTVSIDFFGGEGWAEGVAMVNSGVELLEGELYVYKLVDNRWVRVASAYDSVTSGRLLLSLDFDAESGVTYWAVFTVTETSVSGEIVDSVETEDTCP